MNKIRVNSKVSSKRNREEDVIELIQRIIDLKVDSQRYLDECGYCCKSGYFGKEFTDFLAKSGNENICDNPCSDCRAKYYNFIQELVAKELSEEYQVDFEKVIDGIEEY